MTITDLKKNFLATIDNKNTKKSYGSVLNQFIKWCGGTLPEKQRVLSWRNSMSNISESTRYMKYKVIMKFYDFIDDPMEKKIVRRPKELNLQRNIIPNKKVTEILSNVENRAKTEEFQYVRDAVILKLILCSGLRSTEVSLLNVGDITLIKDSYQIRIRDKGVITNDRALLAIDNLKQSIAQYLKMRQGDAADPLFIEVYKFKYGVGGKRLTNGSVSRIFKKYLREVGLDSSRFTCRSGRHTAITTSIIKDADITTIQFLWKQPDIESLQRYIHMLPPNR